MFNSDSIQKSSDKNMSKDGKSYPIVHSSVGIPPKLDLKLWKPAFSHVIHLETQNQKEVWLQKLKQRMEVVRKGRVPKTDCSFDSIEVISPETQNTSLLSLPSNESQEDENQFGAPMFNMDLSLKTGAENESLKLQNRNSEAIVTRLW